MTGMWFNTAATAEQQVTRRAFVFPVIAAATDAGRWMAAVRTYNAQGRCIRVTVLGGYGRSWDDAAFTAYTTARGMSLVTYL